MTRKYEIRVQGSVSERWTNWFEDMTIQIEPATDGTQITTLSGPLADQAALRGLLVKLWNLNLTLISVSRVEPGAE